MDGRSREMPGSAVSAPSFIGLSDRDDHGGEGNYVWQNHEAAAYRSWAAGEPSTAAANLDCTKTTADGTWSEVDCAATLPYVCEESDTTNVAQVTENATATLTCASGTIHAYTSLYGIGCAGTSPLSCGSCTLGATSCAVTYNNTDCTDCSSGCAKQGGLALSCEWAIPRSLGTGGLSHRPEVGEDGTRCERQGGEPSWR